MLLYWCMKIISRFRVQRFRVPGSTAPLATSIQFVRRENVLVLLKNSKCQTCLGHWILKFEPGTQNLIP
jgi:hypothetical protein